MSIILLNLQSNQQIKLDHENPFIIGRGNVEGCFDKRVSRSHGKITCTLDGRIRLAALHCNPCFFTRNGVPPVVQLNKDEEETLNEGDYLGLLPNAFWFKITSNREIKIKKEIDSSRTDPISVENIRTDLPSESKSTLILQTDEAICNEGAQYVTSDKQNKGNLNSLQVPALNENSNSAGPSNRLGTSEFEKTRRLPLWMYEIDESSEFSYKNPNKHSQLNDRDTVGKKPKLISESVIKKESQTKLGDLIKIENEVTNLDVPSTSKVECNDESSVAIFESQIGIQSKAQVQEEPSREDNKKEGYESDVENVENSGSKRRICQYESNCYRKNEQHKIEFCHPGDSDYVPYEKRPLCQYGAACYRRNEKHRVEFRHPPSYSNSQNLSSPSSGSRGSTASSPLPLKRRRKKVNTQNVDYECDDEYDVEDPFINDASSDEYVPSDLDSEDEEEDFIVSQEN